MVYEFDKQITPGPNTFTVQVEQPEPQEPRKFVIKESSTTIPGRTIQVGQPTPAAQPPQTISAGLSRAFYTIPQLAELLQVHENTIYRLVRAGKIEHYKVGAQIRISADELERLKVERKA